MFQRMPPMLHRLAAALALATSVSADCVTAWPNGAFANNTWGASYINSNPSFAFEREVADDFDFTGRITRVVFDGFNGGPTGSATPVDGVWVRFHEWTAAGPGVLQAAYFVPANDPNLGLESRPSAVEVGLATPFFATGKHFISVQVDFTDYGIWEPWQSNFGAPRLSTGWVRTNNGTWGLYTPLFQTQPLSADVSFTLYTDATSICPDWAPVTVPSPGTDSGLVDLTARSATDVWAVGNSSTSVGTALNSFPFAIHFNGSGWNLAQLPPAPTLGTSGSRTTLEAIEAIGANDVWAAGSHRVVVNGGWVGHQIRADHFDGTSWTTMNTPLPPTSGSAGYSGSRITDIRGFASNDVWFVGEWVGPHPGVVGLQPALAMHWDGASFTLVPTPEVLPNGGNGLEAIDGVASNDIWAVGGSGDGDMASYSYILHWNGSSWTHVPGPLVGFQQRLYAVEAIAANDVWIAGEALDANGYRGVVQHWDGSSWTNVAGAPASFSASLHARSSTDLWLGLWHFDGASWTREIVAGCDPFATAGAVDGAGGKLYSVGSMQLPGRQPYVIERVSSCAPGAYCTGATTSGGCAPRMSAVGTPSASAASGYTLRITGADGQRSGLIFYGTSGRQAQVWAAGSSSFLCVKPPTQRTPLQSSGGTSGACDGTLAVDWSAFLASNSTALGQPLVSGEVFQSQGWLRDPLAAKSTALSDALEFVLVP